MPPALQPPTKTRATRHQPSLQSWFRTSLGRSLLEAEFERLEGLLPGLYGPIAVQLGALGSEFLAACDAVNSYYAPERVNATPGVVSLTTVPEALPFGSKSVGLMVLPHVLEFSDAPHQILREVARVLVPEGHIVIVGFNPFSFWGLRRFLSIPSRSPLWRGRFYPLARVKDWLALLGFEIVRGEMLYHRPPLASSTVRNKLQFMEHAGDRWWPLLAGVYVLVGRKREIGMTPLVPERFRKRSLVPGLAEPVARNGLHKTETNQQ